jgi:UrcA family protein
MRSVILAAAAVGALFATQAAAATNNTADLETRAVSFKGVDFNDPQAVANFYNRLRSTAQEVCSNDSFNSRAQNRACVAQIMNQAVSGMQRPMLTARHDAARSNTAYATGF